jgi:hypothetical protein
MWGLHRGAGRVYVPYGTGWPPYARRDAVRDPRLLARLVRDVVAG